MNEYQALKDVENSLRDFISVLLPEKLGQEWLSKCGISPERVTKWEEKRDTERKKLHSGITEDRIIYFSDFYDLGNIVSKNWEKIFQPVFIDKKVFEVFINQLETYRNTQAHARELLTFQKYLILGISGHIRNRIVAYRSKMETSQDIFPRFESVRDNYGNTWDPTKPKFIRPDTILHPGDVLEFTMTASDPEGLPLNYKIEFNETPWSRENSLKINISEAHIADDRAFLVVVASDRDYHAENSYDDIIRFFYKVYPKRR
jgi:hypothetical protein